MLTKGMAIDWGPHGIQVNGLGPGYFKTELTEALVSNAEFSGWLISRTPSRRWGDVEDLVGAAVFLASDASNFVNGHILYVDGGVTPRFRSSKGNASHGRSRHPRRPRSARRRRAHAEVLPHHCAFACASAASAAPTCTTSSTAASAPSA